MIDDRLPKVHPRSPIVKQAANAIGRALLDIEQQYGLTTTEYLGILAAEMQSTLRYALRAERHPEHPDRPADYE